MENAKLHTVVEENVEKIERAATEVKKGYKADDVPIGSYAILMGTYATVFAGLYALSTRGDRKLLKPKGMDLALLTIASYKLSRIVTMSFIGTPIRAPFTTRGEAKKGGEVQDESRGEGLQKAIGNLVTCPFCFNVWSTTLFMYAYSLAPSATRQAAYILSIAAGGDVLNHGYRSLRETSA